MAESGCGKIKVLLVEDDEAILESVREVLEDHGFHVFTARDGLEALLSLRGTQSPPSFILLDIEMPKMDGLAFLEAKDAEPSFRSIAVVIMTAGRRRIQRQCKESCPS